MREVKRILIKSSCNCSKPQVIFEFNFSLDRIHLEYLLAQGYMEGKSYTNSGILYIEDFNLIAIGPIGSNRLQLKCKNSNCESSIDKLERIIQDMP